MNRSYLVAGAIAGAAVLWVASGAIFSSPGEVELSAFEQAALNKPEGLQRVQVMRSHAVPRTREIKVAGRTEASRQITVRAETESAVIDLVVPRGTAVRKGETLVKLAVEDREARLKQAMALVDKRELEFRAAENLSKKSFTSDVSLANAKAELESARAQLATAQLEIDRITIRAPFDGVFNMNHVDVGDYVRVGDDVAQMVDLDPLLFVAEIAESQISDVKNGTMASAVLLDGRVVLGPVTYVSTVATPETRTFLVEVSVSNPDATLVDGMTATLGLPAQQMLAHKVPPAALTLNDAGAVGVKLVDASGRVIFAEAGAASSSTDSVWLVGLPETVNLITVGQEFVRVGQKVEPVRIGSESEQSMDPLSLRESSPADQNRMAERAGEHL